MRSRAFRRFQAQKRKAKARRIAEFCFGNRNTKMIEKCVRNYNNLNIHPNMRFDEDDGTAKEKLTPQEIRARDSYKDQIEVL